ncbi:unnamed protein product [Caenorhabditis sp. 36 PRJEB53466]|nr:unnamed protein product [Caenorhabditis sp. 36 PRJEB53466]
MNTQERKRRSRAASSAPRDALGRFTSSKKSPQVCPIGEPWTSRPEESLEEKPQPLCVPPHRPFSERQVVSLPPLVVQSFRSLPPLRDEKLVAWLVFASLIVSRIGLWALGQVDRFSPFGFPHPVSSLSLSFGIFESLVQQKKIDQGCEEGGAEERTLTQEHQQDPQREQQQRQP